MDNSKWKTLSREVVFQQENYLTVEHHKIELPDGKIISNWPWIIAPDFVNVVALNEKQEFLFFRQRKYGVEGTSLAPVGGYIEDNEIPIEAAKRELLEETGHQAIDWIELGHYRADANHGGGMGHFFLALGANYVQSINSDDLEEQVLLFLSKARVELALKRGEFKVVPWVTNILLALKYFSLDK